jgi:putative endonuclease
MNKMNADKRTESGSLRPAKITTKARGDWAENLALEHLKARGLRLLQRNYRTPGRGGGEIDLIMQEPDGTVVFAEVRQRKSEAFGGALASVGLPKQRRIVFAARHYLSRLVHTPPCRFDVVAVQMQPLPSLRGRAAGAEERCSAMHGCSPTQVEWLRGAFDAG